MYAYPALHERAWKASGKILLWQQETVAEERTLTYKFWSWYAGLHVVGCQKMLFSSSMQSPVDDPVREAQGSFLQKSLGALFRTREGTWMSFQLWDMTTCGTIGLD